jgi:AraC family transcriptional regulator
VQGGSDCYQKTPYGWRNGGGPGRFCLLPRDDESVWHIRGRLDFIHLYYSDEHLRRVAAHVWDREPASLELPPLAFSEDEKIHSFYQMFIVNCNWADKANHLQMSSCAVLLLNHLVRYYSNVKWKAPRVKGGLAPATLRHVRDWIEANLEQTLTLTELAAQARLSEYHFARMFQQSTRMAPHQFVMQRRLAKAKQLVQTTTYPLMEIAWRCGFSSVAHMSHRFKRQFGLPPSTMRSATFDSCV